MDEQMEMSLQEQRKQRRQARRAKRNARIARGRFWKNLFIWLLGVLCVPTILIAVSFLVPLSTIVGSDGQYVSEDLSKKSLFEVTKTVATNYGEFGFADFPVISKTFSELESTDIGDGKTLGDIVKIDTDKLNAIKFGSSNIGDEVRGCVEVIASLDSIGGTELLGDFGGLSVFTDYDEAGTVAEINVSPKPEGFNAKLYYYKTSEVGTSAFSTESAGYKRAFDNDGNLVSEIAALSESQRNALKLYYPALKDVAFTDLVDIVSDSFDRVTVKSLLTSFGADNDMLLDILGEDTTVKGLKDFDFNTVKLCKVLDAPTAENGMKNEKLYDILREATGKATNEEITIEALSSFNTDAVKLTSVLAYGTDTAKLYDILCDATGKTTAEEIILSDLNNFETDDIKLTSVLENNAANVKLYNILKDLTGKVADEITINDLSGLNTDNIHLITVLDESGNAKLYDIMRDATGAATNSEITIASLSSFDADNIHLITVLAESGNEKLYSIMRDATGAATNSEITIASLSSFDADNIHLTTVIPSSSNKLLKPILEKDATIGNLGTVIDDLEITEIFETECFTTEASAAADTDAKYSYDTTTGTYTLDGAGTYYISKDAKVWLFMLYTASGNSSAAATKGSAETYVKKSVKFSNMESEMGGVSTSFVNATLKQLVQSGIVADKPSYAAIYDKSFVEILDLI